jgi:hypothetical protein
VSDDGEVSKYRTNALYFIRTDIALPFSRSKKSTLIFDDSISVDIGTTPCINGGATWEEGMGERVSAVVTERPKHWVNACNIMGCIPNNCTSCNIFNQVVISRG